MTANRTTDVASKASPAEILGLLNSRTHSGALKPRAVAVLCCLRSDAKTRIQIRNSIGDQSANATHVLLSDLRNIGMVTQRSGDERWYLTCDGVGWLETNGLSVAKEARL